MRRTSLRLIICFGLFSLTAAAQSPPDGVAAINGGRSTIWLKAPSQVFPAVEPTAGLITIYSNLGTGKDVYNAAAGNGILGPNAGQLYQEWVGNGFRPKADHTVLEIQVGATWVQGGNVVIVSLNADNHMRPGKVLHKWQFSHLPTFGSCCALQTAKLNTGILLKKGVLYWVVLKTSPQHTDTWDVWNNDFKGQNGLWSNNIGSGWTKASFQQLNAFGVFGK